jgi:hypothetical protein
MIHRISSDNGRVAAFAGPGSRLCARVLLAGVLALAPALAQSQSVSPSGDAVGNAPGGSEVLDPRALDPRAVEILAGATAFLAAQATMSVDWLVSFDRVADGREKITYLRSGRNLLKRGVGFYSYAEFQDGTREYFFDGQTFQIVDVEENAYVMVPFVGRLDDLADRISAEYDIRLPIWQIMSASPKSDLLDRADSAAYLGIVKIAGRAAYHLALSDYNNDWQVWIATEPDRPELLMVVGTDPYTQGWPQYRAYFSNWNFDPEIPDDAFSFVPDEEADRMAWPKPDNVAQRIGGN